jgi:predicted MFS family arabinose efflux permease
MGLVSRFSSCLPAVQSLSAALSGARIESAAAKDAAMHTRTHWFAGQGPFAVTVLSHFMCAFGFSVFSLFPKYLMTARALSQADTGLATMGFPLGALLFSPLVAFAMGRFAKADIVRVCALMYCALTSSFALTPDPAIIPLLTFLIGGACMGVFNGGAGLVADVAPDHAMARALGLHGAAGMLGHALGPLAMEPMAAQFGWSASFCLAAGSALCASLLPLAQNRPRAGGFSLSLGFLRPLSALLVVTLFAGLMHNALWTAHQPLVLARGGHEMRGYFLGMSGGALIMRVMFGGLPDRLGRARAALYALALYVVAAAGMTWVTPGTLPWFGLVHGVAHGVFYPAMAALATGRVALGLRGESLIAIYAAFNVGATCGSVGFARFGQAFGPASVFPLAAALGSIGLFTLYAYVRRAEARAPVREQHEQVRPAA